MNFQQNGFEIVKNVISPDLLLYLQTEFELINKITLHNMKKNNQIIDIKKNLHAPNSFSFYSPICFETLTINLNNKINEVVGKKLYPSYSFGRIYYKNSKLIAHTDRLSCEYSTTICINGKTSWDFNLIDSNKNHQILKLNPGDMCVYLGAKLKHWRDTYNGKMHMQCFLHYVDSIGEYADFKYDKRILMGTPFAQKIEQKNLTYI